MLSGSLQEQYQQLCQPMQETRVGGKGMLQHIFVRKEDADKLLVWLKQQAVLQPLGIQNASVRQELQNDKKVYVVRLTTQQYKTIVVEEAVQKNSQKVILSEEEQAFLAQNNIASETGLHKIARLAEQQCLAALAKISDTVFNIALTKYDLNGYTPLGLAAMHHSQAVFHAFLAKASSDTINTVLPEIGLDEWTGLHIVARYQSEAGFLALITKASSDAINAALPKQNQDGWTVLHMAARHQSEAGFLTLLEKASSDAINAALPEQNQFGWTGLSVAVRFQSEVGFLGLLEKASSDAINTALATQYQDGWTVSHQVARYQSEASFLALLAKASSDAINAALPKQNQDGWTVLHMAARHQSEAGFLTLLEKASSDAINAALPEQNQFGWTGLSVAVRFQSEASFLAMLAKASPEAINAALPKQTKDKGRLTVLCLAASSCSSKSLIALLEKSSSAAVNAAFSKQPFRLLELLFSYHTPEAIARLLGLVNFNCMRNKINDMPDSILKKVASYLLHESSWQEVLLVQKLFAQMGLQLMPLFLAYYFEGNELPEAVQAAISQILKAKHPDQFSVHEASWLGLMMSPSEERAEVVISTKKNRKIPLNGTVKDGDVIKYISLEGLASWQDYRLLRRHYVDKPGMRTILNELQRRDLHDVNCAIIDNAALAYDEQKKKDVLQTIITNIQNNIVLLKIIRTEHWDEFFQQIKDYNFRPKLRAKEKDKSGATHKFVHLTGEVVAYQARNASLPNIKSSTKKMSTTLFASNLSMSVFGEHRPNEPLVGLLFDRSKCRVKAWLAQDSGTYGRTWLGTKKEADDYKEDKKNVNYTDEEEFIKQVNANPSKLNEVLAEVSRESLLAIVMVKDIPEARETALQRQEQIRRELKIDLPIIYYDRVARKLKESGVTVLLEAKYEEKLLTLEYELRSKTWELPIFSQLNPARLFGFKDKNLPGTADKITKKIEAAKQSASKGHPIWKETLQEVKALLQAANTNSSTFSSTDDSKQEYQKRYADLFG